MMLVLEPNGTLVMYCGMVKVCFADSIFCWIPQHLCTMFLIPNPNTWPACQDLFFFKSRSRQAGQPACLDFLITTKIIMRRQGTSQASPAN